MTVFLNDITEAFQNGQVPYLRFTEGAMKGSLGKIISIRKRQNGVTDIRMSFGYRHRWHGYEREKTIRYDRLSKKVTLHKKGDHDYKENCRSEWVWTKNKKPIDVKDLIETHIDVNGDVVNKNDIINVNGTLFIFLGQDDKKRIVMARAIGGYGKNEKGGTIVRARTSNFKKLSAPDGFADLLKIRDYKWSKDFKIRSEICIG